MNHRDEIPIALLVRRLGQLEPVLRENLWWMRLWSRIQAVVERVKG